MSPWSRATASGKAIREVLAFVWLQAFRGWKGIWYDGEVKPGRWEQLTPPFFHWITRQIGKHVPGPDSELSTPRSWAAAKYTRRHTMLVNVQHRGTGSPHRISELRADAVE